MKRGKENAFLKVKVAVIKPVWNQSDPGWHLSGENWDAFSEHEAGDILKVASMFSELLREKERE